MKKRISKLVYFIEQFDRCRPPLRKKQAACLFPAIGHILQNDGAVLQYTQRQEINTGITVEESLYAITCGKQGRSDVNFFYVALSVDSCLALPVIFSGD
jgi:hypothetical protein